MLKFVEKEAKRKGEDKIHFATAESKVFVSGSLLYHFVRCISRLLSLCIQQTCSRGIAIRDGTREISCDISVSLELSYRYIVIWNRQLSPT